MSYSKQIEIAEFLKDIFNSINTEIRNDQHFESANSSAQITLFRNLALRIDPYFVYKQCAIEGDSKAIEYLRGILNDKNTKPNQEVKRDIKKIFENLNKDKKVQKTQKEYLIVDIQAKLNSKISTLISEWLKDKDFNLLIAACSIFQAKPTIFALMLDPEIGKVDGNSFVPYTCSGEHASIMSSLFSLAMSVKYKTIANSTESISDTYRCEFVKILLDSGVSTKQGCFGKILTPTRPLNLKKLEGDAQLFIDQEFRKKNARKVDSKQEQIIQILQQSAASYVRAYFLNKEVILPPQEQSFENILKANSSLREQLLFLIEKTSTPKIGSANLSGGGAHNRPLLPPLEQAIITFNYKIANKLLDNGPLSLNIPKSLLNVNGDLLVVNVAELLYERASRKLLTTGEFITTNNEFIDIVTTLQLVVRSYPELLLENCLKITSYFNKLSNKNVSVSLISKIILDMPLLDTTKLPTSNKGVQQTLIEKEQNIKQHERIDFILQRLLFDSRVNIFDEMVNGYPPYKIFTTVNEPKRNDLEYDYYIAIRDTRCRYIALLWPKDLKDLSVAEKQAALGTQIAESHSCFMKALEIIQQLYDSFSSSIMLQVISGKCSNKNLPALSKIYELYNSSVFSFDNGLTQWLVKSFDMDSELFELLLNTLLYDKVKRCSDKDGFTFIQEKDWWVHYILGWIAQNHPEFFKKLPCFTKPDLGAVVKYDNMVNRYPISHSGMIACFDPRQNNVIGKRKRPFSELNFDSVAADISKCDKLEDFELKYTWLVDELKNIGRFKIKPQANQLVLNFTPSNTTELQELYNTFEQVRDQEIDLEKYVENEKIYVEVARSATVLPLSLSMVEKSDNSLDSEKQSLLGQAKLKQFRRDLQGLGITSRYLQNYIITVLVQNTKGSFLVENKGQQESRAVSILFSVLGMVIDQFMGIIAAQTNNDDYFIKLSQQPNIKITYDQCTRSAIIQITGEFKVFQESTEIGKLGNMICCVRLFENPAFIPDFVRCQVTIRPSEMVTGLDLMQEIKNYLTELKILGYEKFNLFNLIVNDTDGVNSLKAIKSIIESSQFKLFSIEYLRDLYKLIYKKIAIAGDPIIVNRWLTIVDIFNEMIPVEIRAKISTSVLSDRYLSYLKTHTERREYWIEVLTLAEQLTALLHIGNHCSPYTMISLNVPLLLDHIKKLVNSSDNVLDKLMEMKRVLEMPENLDADQLQSVIQVFGSYIRRLRLDSVSQDTTISFLHRLILKNCPQLVQVEVNSRLYEVLQPSPFMRLPIEVQYKIFNLLPANDKNNFAQALVNDKIFTFFAERTMNHTQECYLFSPRVQRLRSIRELTINDALRNANEMTSPVVQRLTQSQLMKVQQGFTLEEVQLHSIDELNEKLKDEEELMASKHSLPSC